MEELPAIIKVKNETITSEDTVVKLTKEQSKYLDSNIIIIEVKQEVCSFPDNLNNHVSIESACKNLDIKQELEGNIEVPDDVSAEDISTLCHDFKIEIEECDLSQIKMETEESNSTSTSSEQTKHVTNNTLEDDLCVEQPEQFICASCNKSFTSKYSLIKHIEQHKCEEKSITGEKTHTCQYCPYQAAHARNLKKHMLLHTGKKTHICQYCPYKALRSHDLKRHILTHTGEKPHACQYCPYKALRPNDVRRHMLIHTGEKPHACQYCPYKTRNVRNLKRHVCPHTNEETHACQYCPYKAVYLSQLKRHMLTHTGEETHSCQYCPFTTRQESNLKLHMLTHTVKKQHACQYCPYTTEYACSLKRHMLTHSKKCVASSAR